MVEGLRAGLLAVGHRLGPHLAAQGMMRQAFHLIVQSLPGQRLQRRDDARVQPAPPLLEQAPIGHLMGEGMLEDERVSGNRLVS